jgi:transposase
MTTKTRRAFTDEFKAETVTLLESSGRPLTQIAAIMGRDLSTCPLMGRRSTAAF